MPQGTLYFQQLLTRVVHMCSTNLAMFPNQPRVYLYLVYHGFSAFLGFSPLLGNSWKIGKDKPPPTPPRTRLPLPVPLLHVQNVYTLQPTSALTGGIPEGDAHTRRLGTGWGGEGSDMSETVTNYKRRKEGPSLLPNKIGGWI